MDKKTFNNLSDEEKERYLKSWFKLQTILDSYEINNEEAEKILESSCVFVDCTEFDAITFAQFLSGLFPIPFLNIIETKEETELLLKLSDSVVTFVFNWNKALQDIIEQLPDDEPLTKELVQKIIQKTIGN